MSDSDEEAIVEFVKQHKELYDKTNDSFKDKQKEEGLWEQLAATRNLPVKTVKKWFDTQRTRYGKLTQTKSGQAAEKSTERQTWLKDSFSFLRGHIRRKGVSKSSAFKSPQRPSAAAASVPDTSRDTESEMEISIASVLSGRVRNMLQACLFVFTACLFFDPACLLGVYGLS